MIYCIIGKNYRDNYQLYENFTRTIFSITYLKFYILCNFHTYAMIFIFVFKWENLHICVMCFNILKNATLIYDGTYKILNYRKFRLPFIRDFDLFRLNS